MGIYRQTKNFSRGPGHECGTAEFVQAGNLIYRSIASVRQSVRLVPIRVQNCEKIPSNPPLAKGGRGDFECESALDPGTYFGRRR